MKSNFGIIWAITCLALAALACRAVSGEGGDNTPVAPTEAQPNILLSDDFSSAQWGIGTDLDSSVEYANEALQMIIYTKNNFMLSTPDEQDYQNVHMEVTVINNDTDSTTAFGLICNQQVADDSFYYFAMTPAGQYAIAKATVDQSDVFLTNNDEWANSDLIAKDASSYRVGVCPFIVIREENIALVHCRFSNCILSCRRHGKIIERVIRHLLVAHEAKCCGGIRVIINHSHFHMHILI